MPFQGMLMWWPFPRAAPGATLTAPLQGACVQSPRTYAGKRPHYARRGWLGRVNEPSRRSGRDARTTAGIRAPRGRTGGVCDRWDRLDAEDSLAAVLGRGLTTHEAWSHGLDRGDVGDRGD